MWFYGLLSKKASKISHFCKEKPNEGADKHRHPCHNAADEHDQNVGQEQGATDVDGEKLFHDQRHDIRTAGA